MISFRIFSRIVDATSRQSRIIGDRSNQLELDNIQNNTEGKIKNNPKNRIIVRCG